MKGKEKQFLLHSSFGPTSIPFIIFLILSVSYRSRNLVITKLSVVQIEAQMEKTTDDCRPAVSSISVFVVFIWVHEWQ